jgi:predicted membrane protein
LGFGWVAFTFHLLLCIVSALGVGSFFYIPSISFWIGAFKVFMIKVWFKLTTFFFFFFFLKKKNNDFQRKLHHLISLFKTLRFPDNPKEKKKVSVRGNEMMGEPRQSSVLLLQKLTK